MIKNISDACCFEGPEKFEKKKNLKILQKKSTLLTCVTQVRKKLDGIQRLNDAEK